MPQILIILFLYNCIHTVPDVFARGNLFIHCGNDVYEWILVGAGEEKNCKKINDGLGGDNSLFSFRTQFARNYGGCRTN